MTTIIASNNSDVSVYGAGTDSEERLALLSAYYKGVSFEIHVTPEKAHFMTEINPTDHITILTNRGEPLAKQKSFWIRRMTLWVAIYKKLMSNNDKYLGEDMDMLILDMIKEAANTPSDDIGCYNPSEFNKKSDDDKCQYWMWGWFLGVGVLKHLGVIEDDDDNGFQKTEGPKSLMLEFVDKRNADAVKMKKDISGGDPMGLD